MVVSPGVWHSRLPSWIIGRSEKPTLEVEWIIPTPFPLENEETLASNPPPPFLHGACWCCCLGSLLIIPWARVPLWRLDPKQPETWKIGSRMASSPTDLARQHEAFYDTYTKYNKNTKIIISIASYLGLMNTYNIHKDIYVSRSMTYIKKPYKTYFYSCFCYFTA